MAAWTRIGTAVAVLLCAVAPLACAADDRFTPDGHGSVIDSQTGLSWADHDNGVDISWPRAKRYVEEFRGGGYSDWRLPTIHELEELEHAGSPWNPACNRSPADPLRVMTPAAIHVSCFLLWAGETNGSEAAIVSMTYGAVGWAKPNTAGSLRVLPVRSTH